MVSFEEVFNFDEVWLIYSFFKGCPWFIENITAQQKDSNGSTWCSEIHPSCRLSDQWVGQAAKLSGITAEIS